MSTKQIKTNEEAKALILEGARKAASIIGSTMGPGGENVIMGFDNGSIHVTKDGVSVAKEVQLENPFENIGARLLIESSVRTNELAGDGTTTAAVLAYSILEQGNKVLNKDINPHDFIAGINLAVTETISLLEEDAKPIATIEDALHVANVASNWDAELVSNLKEAYQAVGLNGVLTITDSVRNKTKVTLVKGMEINQGYISPSFITDQKTGTCVLENARVLVYHGSIKSENDLLGLISPMLEAKEDNILIICTGITPQASQLLIANHSRDIIKCCVIAAPDYGSHQEESMMDIAAFTGATYLSEKLNDKLTDQTISCLGRAKKITISADTTLISEGNGCPKEIQNRLDNVIQRIEQCTSEADKDQLELRKLRLISEFVSIEVGAPTFHSRKELQDRFVDATQAVKAAADGGVIAGGGGPLTRISRILHDRKSKLSDNRAVELGYEALCAALRAPLTKICENAGVSYGEHLSELCMNAQTGFDVKSKSVVHIDDGIIDPVKVTKTALINAAAVATLLLTSSSVMLEPVTENSRRRFDLM